MDAECRFYINRNLATGIIASDSLYENLLSEQVLSFHESLKDYSISPLLELPALAKELGINNVFVKDESNRLNLNSFKILGVSYVVQEMLKKTGRANTVFCTATEGNHGKALARTAKRVGAKAVIFVPCTIDPVKLDSIKAEGASIETVNGDYDEAVRIASIRSKENNWILIQDTSFEGYKDIPLAIMAGYTTIFKEVTRQLQAKKESVDIVFLQAGVGSLAAAAVYYYSMLGKAKPQIIIVEPSFADGCLQSAKNGQRMQTMNSGNTILTGLNCRTPSEVAWPILQQGVDVFLSIPDLYAQQAVENLRLPLGKDPSISAGYSGATGLAGMFALKKEKELGELMEYLKINHTSNILIVNTESNQRF